MAIGAALVVALLGAGASSTTAAIPLASRAFAVADTTLFDGTSIGTGYGDPGSWSFVRGRMVGGHLELHFDIAPPQPTLPVESGPAVLFAGLSLYGDAGGDVGIGRSVAPIAHELLPACNDGDCHYAADISIPIDGLPDAIASLERDGKLIWVSADVTLVRTFGAGEWLQVLAFRPGPGGISDIPAGTLGAMKPTSGVLDWVGLFPADQANPVSTGNGNLPDLDYGQLVGSLRAKADDTSAAIPTVDATMDIRAIGVCPSGTEVTVHDDHGNDLFYTDDIPSHPLMQVSTRMPVGSSWFISMDAGEGVQRSLVRLGPITPDGSGTPVTVTATIDCAVNSGTLLMSGTATPTPISTPAAASAGPSAQASVPSPASGPTGSPVLPESDSPTASTGPVAALVALGIVLAAVIVVALTMSRRRRAS